MTQPVLQRPSPRAPDYKTRFGLDPQTGPEHRPRLQLKVKPTAKKARPSKVGRYASRALGVALLMGTFGAAAFFVGQDPQAFLRLITPSQDKLQTAETLPAQSPAPVSELSKTTNEESPVLVPPAVLPEEPPAQPAMEVATAPAPDSTQTVVEQVEQTVAEASTAASPEVATEPLPEPVPASVPEPVPAAAVQPEPQPVQEAAVVAPTPQQVTPDVGAAYPYVPGQVFRDCQSCPDLVVVMLPRAPVDGVNVTHPGDLQNLPPFALGRLEVTFDDWALCVANGGCAENPADQGWGRGTRPVINVSHEMITSQYLPWLSSLTRAEYRLPTATEWDYAASSIAIPSVQPAVLVDGGNVCRTANFADASASSGDPGCNDGFSSTAPSGVLLPNGLGLHDMRGNVWEWTSDCWVPGFTYKTKASESDCRRRMLRGGAWSTRAVPASTPLHGWEDANKTKNAIGFRVLRTLP